MRRGRHPPPPTLPDISFAERMADVGGLAVTHESVARFSTRDNGNHGLRDEINSDCELDWVQAMYYPPPPPPYPPVPGASTTPNPTAQTEPFEFEKCVIPEPCEMVFKIREDGTYAVYPDSAVVAFDSVDDGSRVERRISKKSSSASAWDLAMEPPYSYWLYHLYTNLISLNHIRASRGFNTFLLRGAGDPDHLTSAFLTSHSIFHGILRRKIGVAMSPLSNNALFLTYERNPFLAFFQRGLNVSLSPDDLLQFHFTNEPLIEEYNVAAQIWKLSGTDMCEVARNSVLHSRWEMKVKEHWLRCAICRSSKQRTNVPSIRLAYRNQTLMEERLLVLDSLLLRSHEASEGEAAAIVVDASGPTTHTGPVGGQLAEEMGDLSLGLPVLRAGGAVPRAGRRRVPTPSDNGGLSPTG
ncbi:hypothetical protein BJ742DRAFT_855709 [Cladochytrium replicatum]|nr:hypothetical protein BJ742DRAFT_855709 [Cladochytrium replicatum]